MGTIFSHHGKLPLEIFPGVVLFLAGGGVAFQGGQKLSGFGNVGLHVCDAACIGSIVFLVFALLALALCVVFVMLFLDNFHFFKEIRKVASKLFGARDATLASFTTKNTFQTLLGIIDGEVVIMAKFVGTIELWDKLVEGSGCTARWSIEGWNIHEVRFEKIRLPESGAISRLKQVLTGRVVRSILIFRGQPTSA